MLKQEKAAGSETLRGGGTLFGKAGRRGDGRRLQAVTGSLHFFARGRAYGDVKCFYNYDGDGTMPHIATMFRPRAVLGLDLF